MYWIKPKTLATIFRTEYIKGKLKEKEEREREEGRWKGGRDWEGKGEGREGEGREKRREGKEGKRKERGREGKVCQPISRYMFRLQGDFSQESDSKRKPDITKFAF